MRTIKGSNRVVLVVRRGRCVLKFPRIYHLLRVVRIIPKLILKPKFRWRLIFLHIKWGWQGFRSGIRQNLAEYRCWKSCAAPFLAPTYFSIGLINIQKFQQGEQPSQSEMSALLIQMDERTNGQRKAVDGHCFAPQNFIKNHSGYCIVDYGDVGNYLFRFTDYIVKWQSELAIILSTITEAPSKG